MGTEKLTLLVRRLEDDRGKRVVFLSHCLLNQNVRYLGGAFRGGGVLEVVEHFMGQSIGICQMPCPEQKAWGGVLKRHVVPFYGSAGTLPHRLHWLAVPLFVLYTRLVYRQLAKRIARDIEDYVRSGIEVVGIVGIGGSPSCGLCTSLDIERSFEALAACPVARIDRKIMNEQVIGPNILPGEGFFMKAIHRQLRRRKLEVPFFEHDLLSEMRGEPAAVRPVPAFH